MPINWNDGLSVGIPEIDQQHKDLIHTINELHRAMREGRSREVQLKVVEELTAYALEHFATEERYFRNYNFPEAEGHIQRHQAFLERINVFRSNLDLGKSGVGIEICIFINDWLQKHVSEEDQQYAEYFREQGLTWHT